MKSTPSNFTCTATLASLVGLAAAAWPLTAAAQDQTISLAAFADVNYGHLFGPVASPGQAEQFASFGEDGFAKSSNQGFGLVGTDFVVTGELDEKFIYLGEVNLQVARGQQSEFELDVERMFLEYRIKPTLNLQAGLFFTPIGYFNRNLYARAWMMVSAQIPDLWEEEVGLVPTHTIGLQAYGQWALPADHSFNYAVSVGNGRASDPVAAIYARDDDGWRALTGMVEWRAPGFRQFRVGLSGWFDRIRTFAVAQPGEVRSVTDPTTRALRLRELGVEGHFVLDATRVHVLVDYLYQRHDAEDGALSPPDDHTVVHGGMFEFGLNLLEDGRLKPYLRCDLVKRPSDGGPYFGLRREGDELTRVFVPQTRLGIAGVAYDFAPRVRAKLEYSRAFTGVRAGNGLLGQVAFAF